MISSLCSQLWQIASAFLVLCKFVLNYQIIFCFLLSNSRDQNMNDPFLRTIFKTKFSNFSPFFSYFSFHSHPFRGLLFFKFLVMTVEKYPHYFSSFFPLIRWIWSGAKSDIKDCWIYEDSCLFQLWLFHKIYPQFVLWFWYTSIFHVHFTCIQKVL